MTDHTDEIRNSVGQFDHKLRAVSLPNLDAMCGHVSGMCHTFAIESCAGKYCRVSYSNPDEYGHSRPIVALFPIIEYCGGIAVLLTIDKVLHTTEDSEDWQSFQTLTDCPELWRKSSTALEWKTREQWEEHNGDTFDAARTAREYLDILTAHGLGTEEHKADRRNVLGGLDAMRPVPRSLAVVAYMIDNGQGDIQTVNAVQGLLADLSNRL